MVCSELSLISPDSADKGGSALSSGRAGRGSNPMERAERRVKVEQIELMG